MPVLTVTLRANGAVGDAVVSVTDANQVETNLDQTEFDNKGNATIKNFTPYGQTGFNAELSITPTGFNAHAYVAFSLGGTVLPYSLAASNDVKDTGVKKFRDGSAAAAAKGKG